MSHHAHESMNIPQAQTHSAWTLFQEPHVAVKNIAWLLKVYMQNESGPEGYCHFCEQDVTWSFYSADRYTNVCLRVADRQAARYRPMCV